MGLLARLGGADDLGKAGVPVAWSLYDFANTIFSFAVVSYAMGLWLVADDRFGDRRRAVLVRHRRSPRRVGLNALVSPILGAISDRGGRRLPYLLFFTAQTSSPTALIGAHRRRPSRLLGLVLFTLANFAYQAALIYYDATLPRSCGPRRAARLGDRRRGRLHGDDRHRAAPPDHRHRGEQRFFMAAGLFALFAIPIFLFVAAKPADRPVPSTAT